MLTDKQANQQSNKSQTDITENNTTLSTLRNVGGNDYEYFKGMTVYDSKKGR